MKYFIWRMAGADCELLERSGKDSQYSFFVIGVLYLFVIGLTFLGFFGLFWGVFRCKVTEDGILQSVEYPFFTALIGGLVLGFLVSNIYRLNLMSLEPNTLPVKKEDASLILTHILRYTTILLFAFFVSKNIEMEIVNIMESAGIFYYKVHERYMDHMVRMNKEQPWLWIITFVIGLVFLLPVFLRQRLNKTFEYYSLKERRDIRLVLEQYEEFLKIKNQILNDHYLKYRALGVEKKYSYKKLYKDEPFNTKRIEIERELGTNEDFLDAILKNT
jgi:hypothetical protein